MMVSWRQDFFVALLDDTPQIYDAGRPRLGALDADIGDQIKQPERGEKNNDCMLEQHRNQNNI